MNKLRIKNLIILLVVFTSLFLFACGKNDSDDESLAISSAKPDDTTITISESEILSYLDESSCMWEFVQRFFDDIIIYKTKLGTWAYEPVDETLPKSNYDWDNLRHAGPIALTEWEYYEGSELKSIKGIDISQYNAVVDWNKVKSDGVEFVILRAGYRGYGTGKLTADTKFLEYAKGAYDAGINLGVYFVTQAVSVDEAIEEAEFVLDLMKESGAEFTWPIALDLEDAASADARTANLDKETRTEYIIAFCERIKEAGYNPMLYAAIRWYIEEMDLSRLTDYNKWFAQYFNRPFFPYEFQIWQYTSSGKVDGIDGNVDLDLCFVNYNEKESSGE